VGNDGMSTTKMIKNLYHNYKAPVRCFAPTTTTKPPKKQKEKERTEQNRKTKTRYKAIK